MIQRSRDRLVVEGPVAGESAGSPDATIRLRIEMDSASGQITAVSPVSPVDAAEGGSEAPGQAPDLRLDDDHLIFPGFIDAHVHAREDVTGKDNYKEDFESAGAAAVHGGITVYAEMPNNPEPPLDDSSYLAKRELCRKSAAEVLPFAIIGANTSPLSFPVPYKVYMAESIGDFFFRSEEELRHSLPRYRDHFIAFHAELPEMLLAHAGEADHYARRPPEAEVEAIRLALSLCDGYRIECHICHLSTAAGLDLIREARARGQRVTTEVTPHHLYYDTDNFGGFSRVGYLQCNPPIRTRLDRLALLEGLRRGDIDYLATDHAPHTIEEKDRGMSGVTHLDTLGSFVFWLLQEGFTLRDIRRVCTENPARFVSRYLPHRYGKIEPGFAASLTVLETSPTTIRREDLRTKAGWSAFEGQTFGGRVSHTIVRGELHSFN